MSAYQNIDEVSSDTYTNEKQGIGSAAAPAASSGAVASSSSEGGLQSNSSLANNLKQHLQTVELHTQGYDSIDDENQVVKGFFPMNLYQFTSIAVAIACILFKVIFIPILNAATTDGFAQDRVKQIMISSYAIFLPLKLVVMIAAIVALVLLFRDQSSSLLRSVSVYTSIALYAIMALETLIDIEIIGMILHYWRYFGEKPAEQTATILVVIGVAIIFLVCSLSFVVKFQKMLRVSMDNLGSAFQKIVAVLKVNSFTVIMTLLAIFSQFLFIIYNLVIRDSCTEVTEFVDTVEPALTLYGLVVCCPIVIFIAIGLNALVGVSIFRALKDDWTFVRRVHKWLEVLTLLLVAAVCGQAATFFTYTITFQARAPIHHVTCRPAVWSMEAGAITMIVISVLVSAFEIIRSFAVGKELVQDIQPETPSIKLMRNNTFPVLSIISAAVCFLIMDAAVLPMLKSECALAEKPNYKETEQSLTLIGWALFAPAKLICVVAGVLLLRWLRRTDGNLVRLIKIITNWVGVASCAVAAIQGVVSVCLIGEFLAIHLPEQQTLGQLRCFKGMLGALVWCCIQVFVNLVLSGIGAARIVRLTAVESRKVSTVVQYFKQQSFSIAVIAFAAITHVIDIVLLPLHKARCGETPGAPEDSVRLVIGLGLGLFLPLSIIISLCGIVMFVLPFWLGFDFIPFFSRKIKIVAVILVSLIAIKVSALMGILADCAAFPATECGKISIAALKVYAVEAVVIITMCISEIARFTFFDEAPVEEYTSVVSANTANTL